MGFWVYILASRRGGTPYVGVTNDLIRHDTAAAAIQREKNIKHWPREWKIDLILSMNPDWRDLYDDITR
jgi:putative endonuclease